MNLHRVHNIWKLFNLLEKRRPNINCLQKAFFYMYVHRQFDGPKFKLVMKNGSQNAGCIFAYLFGGRKINFGYNFVVPLN